LTDEDHWKLQRHCQAAGIVFLSTPFEAESADFLEQLDVPAFKVSSGDVTNLPFLDHVARKRRPVILSTGMATLAEVDAAVATITRHTRDLVLLHCVSAYPADPADANLRVLESMRATFGLPVGFSDHTAGITTATVAVALGASVLEKHFTLSRDMPGPDHRASLEPSELTDLIRSVRLAEDALGSDEKRARSSESDITAAARKSLVAAVDIEPGTIVEPRHVATMRPGTGLSPALCERLLGKRTRVAIAQGTLFEWEMVE
jgi:sialic acid synthase SpsE